MRTRRRASAGIGRRFGRAQFRPFVRGVLGRKSVRRVEGPTGCPFRSQAAPAASEQWFGSDAEALVPLANDPYIARYLSHVFPQPYTRADADRWIQANRATSESVGQFAIEVGTANSPAESGSCVGSGERIGTASLGYWLGRRYWGRGVMSEAVAVATQWAFDTLRVRRVWANVMAPNAGSSRVLEKAGYRLEAKMTAAICDRRGMIHDEYIFARMRPN